jgi:Lantibiotic dehydratase, N terminus
VVGPNLGASAAGRNLGRFADLIGDEATAALQAVGRAEVSQNPNCIWAELVYLPWRFRSANVAVRPHPRPFEIAFGTTPRRPSERVIPVDELVVGIKDNRFYLRWPERDSNVIACSGHMLNNMQAPDICRFLDDLGRDSGHNSTPSTGDRQRGSRYCPASRWDESCFAPPSGASMLGLILSSRPIHVSPSGRHSWPSVAGGRCPATCI